MTKEDQLIIYTDTDENDFSVPQKQWNKWSRDQRRVFNLIFSSMCDDPSLFQHPEATTSYEHYTVTAWNAAWNSADLIGEHILC